jgi:quinol monooxygenase YgiN
VISRRALLVGAAGLGAASLLLEGSSMERFALFGKIVAKPGERDALLAHLLEASRLVSPLPGCDLYIVSVAPTDPDAIFVFELWRSEADHDASLKVESTKALIARARPLMAGGESTRLVPKGGKGVPGA